MVGAVAADPALLGIAAARLKLAAFCGGGATLPCEGGIAVSLASRASSPASATSAGTSALRPARGLLVRGVLVFLCVTGLAYAHKADGVSFQTNTLTHYPSLVHGSVTALLLSNHKSQSVKCRKCLDLGWHVALARREGVPKSHKHPTA